MLIWPVRFKIPATTPLKEALAATTALPLVFQLESRLSPHTVTGTRYMPASS